MEFAYFCLDFIHTCSGMHLFVLFPIEAHGGLDYVGLVCWFMMEDKFSCWHALVAHLFKFSCRHALVAHVVVFVCLFQMILPACSI